MRFLGGGLREHDVALPAAVAVGGEFVYRSHIATNGHNFTSISARVNFYTGVRLPCAVLC